MLIPIIHQITQSSKGSFLGSHNSYPWQNYMGKKCGTEHTTS